MTTPETFFRYALLIGVVIVGFELVERIDPRLGTWYVIVVLLGVAVTQREGVLKLTSFIQSQTAKGV